jgi:hypothetical protein
LGRVSVDYGVALGLSFFDGILAIGFGGIFYDKRDFKNPEAINPSWFQNNYLYFNIQPVSALRAVIKNGQLPAAKGL